MSNTKISYRTRFAQLREQRAYERRIASAGPKAAIAPYVVVNADVRVPAQRTAA